MAIRWGNSKEVEGYLVSNHGCSLQYHLTNLHGGSTAFCERNITALFKEIRNHSNVTEFKVFSKDEFKLTLEPKTKEGAK
ncbi:hypothetical protein [Bacillus cereus]|uniref:hypothetical protein n=1 Tax=Bacillus cereus TaxID=1396 RepID=UPI0012FA419C|nr:hypothetical protein [Bacillus cereus]